jgi:hypothetical protein
MLGAQQRSARQRVSSVRGEVGHGKDETGIHA